MKPHLEAIQDQLLTISELQYVDEDWGQLDDYSPNFPVKWPCALIDVRAAEYTNLGIDQNQTPRNRQMGTFTVGIILANLKLTNSSGRAPQGHQDDAFAIWELQQKVHEVIHGFRPADNASGLIRTAKRRIRRDDGVQQYEILYTFEVSDC